MSKRSNQEWVTSLKGNEGKASQATAYQDLGRYLWKVAYNYLQNKQGEGSISALHNMDHQELVALAFDFTQDMLERVADDQANLLAQYKGKGRFTSWMAVILHRHIGRELSRAHWRQTRPLVDDSENEEWQLDQWVLNVTEHAAAYSKSPAKQAEYRSAVNILIHCLQALDDRRATALLGCLVENASAQEVAERMGVSASSIYNLVMRAKRDVRGCVETQLSAVEIKQIFQFS